MSILVSKEQITSIVSDAMSRNNIVEDNPIKVDDLTLAIAESISESINRIDTKRLLEDLARVR